MFIPDMFIPAPVIIDGHIISQADGGLSVIYYIAVLVASYFLNQVLAQRPKNNTQAATEDDWDFPQTDEGTAQCVFFGDCWTSDWQVLAYGNYRYEPIRK